ncbi:hypothetical protein TNCV_4667231 [Trichonephila clavipes]|nr:hypothetical protein TNCV_4667231 [Trichonephila clavipes]
MPRGRHRASFDQISEFDRCLRCQWYGGHGQRNGTTLCLLTNSASCTLNSQRYISEVLESINVWSSHTFSACHQPYSSRIVHDHTWHVVVNRSLSIRLNCFLGLLVLPVYRQSKTCDPCLHNDWPEMHHSLLHQINFGNMWKPHGDCCTPRIHSKPL